MGDFEKFLAMDFKSGFLFLTAAVIVAVFFIQKWDFIIGRFGIKTKHALENEKRDKDTAKNTQDITELKEKFDNFIDRSETHDTEILSEIKEMKKNFEEDSKRRDHISAMEVRFSLTQRCEDAIARQQITFRGLQSIDDLYDVYNNKDYLGMNSYVTALVQKVHKLDIISDIEE